MKKDKESKLKILLPILAIVIVMALIFNRFLFKLKDQIDGIALPVQSKVYKFTNRIIGIKDIIFSYEDIIAENENLKKENMTLKLEKIREDKIYEENERLLKLLAMKESSLYRGELKFARVSFTDVNNINNKIYIDLGKEDNVKVNMIAVYGEYLVGKISKVYDNYSELELITNPNSIVSVRSENDILGIARGSDEENGLLYFQPSIYEDNLTVGNEILTSGMSDIYPEGIKIGKIEKVNDKESYTYKMIILKPGFENKDLKELIVIGQQNKINRPIVKEKEEVKEGETKK